MPNPHECEGHVWRDCADPQMQQCSRCFLPRVKPGTVFAQNIETLRGLFGVGEDWETTTCRHDRSETDAHGWERCLDCGSWFKRLGDDSPLLHPPCQHEWSEGSIEGHGRLCRRCGEWEF